MERCCRSLPGYMSLEFCRIVQFLCGELFTCTISEESSPPRHEVELRAVRQVFR